MKLIDLITAVKEKNLTKDQLEAYRDDLSNVSALMFIEMADLEKAEALFLDQCVEPTESGKRRKWKAGSQGQRQIELKNYIRSADKILSSLKSRLYSIY